MYCKNCGTKLEEGALFCPSCGYRKEDEQFSEPVKVVRSDKAEEYALNEQAKSILVMGILAIAFTETLIFSFLSIIFGAITSKKVKAYVKDGGILSGKAKVGKILGKIGLILGIVITVFVVLYIVLIAGFIGSFYY